MNAVAAFSLLIVGLSCGSFAVSAQGVPPLSSLDKCLNGAGKPIECIRFTSTKDVTFFYSVTDQTVQGVWSWIPSEAPEGVTHTEVYAQPFRPTAIKKVNPASLLVAGVGAGGATLIERWDFGPPTTRAVRQASPGGGAGGFVYLLTPGPIIAKSTLFSDPNGTDGPINFILTNHGAPGCVIVGFYGTLNIYTMSLATGQLTIAVSGSQFSNLTTGFWSFREEDSPTKGFIYLLKANTSATELRLFLIRDANRTGQLASAPVELDGDDYVAHGYGDGVVLNNLVEW